MAGIDIMYGVCSLGKTFFFSPVLRGGWCAVQRKLIFKIFQKKNRMTECFVEFFFWFCFYYRANIIWVNSAVQPTFRFFNFWNQKFRNNFKFIDFIKHSLYVWRECTLWYFIIFSPQYRYVRCIHSYDTSIYCPIF